MASTPITQEKWDNLISSIDRRVRCEATASDIAQESYVTACAKGGPVNLPYIWGIAKNKIREHFRERGRQQRLGEAYGGAHKNSEWAPPAEWTTAEMEQLHAELDVAVGRLSSKNQMLMREVYVEGRSQKDIAARLGSTHEAVRTEVSRTRKLIRHALLPLLLALLVLRTREASEPLAAYQSAEVALESPLRAPPQQVERPSHLSLKTGDHFLIRCRVPGKRFNAERVRAVQAAADARGEARALAVEVREATPDGVLLRVRASLPVGRWEVTCEVTDLDLDRSVQLGPSAVLEVR